MTASMLFCGLTEAVLPAVDISLVTENSKQAHKNAVFVCICGANFNGHVFSKHAYANGCRVFVAEQPLSLPPDAAVIYTQSTKRMLAKLANRFYGEPSRQMHLVGITGTKGKTTTAHMLVHILNENRVPCGYIGTTGVRYGNVEYPLTNTTPDAVTLQKALREMLDAGIRTAVVEVSSQALLCHRADGTRFQTVMFTNLSADHIGKNEHRDLADYKACKHRLFTDFGADCMIYNADDPVADEMQTDASAKKKIATSSTACADYTAKSIKTLRAAGHLGIACTVEHAGSKTDLTLSMIGKMNVENALLAIAAASECFSIPPRLAAKSLSDMRVVGRSEVYPISCDAVAVIDYAHNRESLRRLLETLREYRPNRLIALFGSVGERSKHRRAELGAVAGELCDLCILTSDNPGCEDPNAIIAEIAAAVAPAKTPYITIPNRAEAIREAVHLVDAGDILVLAGKGHENYQKLGSELIPFSDRETLADAIQSMAIK